MREALVISPPVNGVAITVSTELEAVKAELLAESRSILTVDEGFTQEIAVGSVRELKNLLATVEASRVDIKSPVLDLGRKIDDAAKRFRHDIEAEVDRLTKCITTFQIAERKRAEEAERLRLNEIARLEKLRLEAEQAERQRQTEAAAAQEAQRKADEAAFMADTAEESKASETAKQEALKSQQQAEAAAQQERQRQQAIAEQQRLAAAVKTEAPTVATGMSVKPVWTFEVTDLWELARDNRDLVRIEPNVAAIKAAISGGMRRCPGLRIYEETKVGVR